MATSLLTALRDATSDLHLTLERDADVEAALRARDRRPAIVARFLALHSAVEAALRPWTETIAACGYSPEARSPMIARDLADLGASASIRTVEPAVRSLGEALGWLYVAEGSMLGGRVMRKAMRRDGVSLRGLTFLDPHADETGRRWQTFLQALETAESRGLVSEVDVVTGGRDAFMLAHRLLVSTRTVESAA